MIAEQEPLITPYLDLDPVQSLPPEDRALLTILLTGSGSLADLASQCGLDLLTLAERLLAPEIQAALESIKRAAIELSHVRALIGRPIAIATLEAVSTEINPNPIERRRAASALLRAAPAGSGYPHAPRGANSVHHATRAAPPQMSAHPNAAPDLHAASDADPNPPPHHPDPYSESSSPPSTPPSIAIHAGDRPPTPTRGTDQTALSAPDHSTPDPHAPTRHPPDRHTLDRPKPTPKSRDRPPNPRTLLIPLAGKPPLIAAA